MNVLSIHWGFSLGGVGKYAQLIDSVYRYEPVKVTSLCILGKNWWYDDIGLEKIKAHKIFINNRYDFTWLIKVARIIDEMAPDLIMTHGFNGHFVATITRTLAKTKSIYICSYHGSYYGFSPIRKLFQKLINCFTEAYIHHCVHSCAAVSRFSKKNLTRKGIASSRIKVIYNGIKDEEIPIKFRKKFRKDWEVCDNEILLGVASRLDPFKGIDYLIKAFYDLCENNKRLKLVIIGSGTIERTIKESSKKLGKRVIFAGFRPDVPKCLLAIDIFILPSLAENHSIALIEAMRAGKAIIATNVGGNTESVRHLKEGLIIPASDSKALKIAAETLIYDRLLAETLGRAAKERFKNKFTEEIMVRQTAQWLIKCGTLKTSNQLGPLNRK
jgi:glycosyltransferase involved in cell wall biosynthesis